MQRHTIQLHEKIPMEDHTSQFIDTLLQVLDTFFRNFSPSYNWYWRRKEGMKDERREHGTVNVSSLEQAIHKSAD